ncbi:hypothetical protein J0B03_05710 [Alkalibacter rhizosphaerae]|uniref:DUF7768 domain-containing protein n=1 Tax=Alkalibacter rhizosphaerae TaxID=2815577 RepID=A0A974XJI0_9FIRM|nr:DUF4406 domain-containing protein [Alkalibacter rhizosphaerae]QSX09558.1 hypothetical protein J0B03_05710 [Alkalibacter rhizosphaerae]
MRENKLKEIDYDRPEIYEVLEEKSIVFICSPYAGDIDGNTMRARRYARFATATGAVPVIPHLMYPQFLEEDDPDERQLGIDMGLTLLKQCSELWVFGNKISSGMSVEIEKAEQWEIPIRFFSIDCKVIVKNKKLCFAYHKGECSILEVSRCEGSKCNFFKTKAQVKEEKKKKLQRIKSLDPIDQRWIIDTYCDGRMSILDEVEVE